MDTPKLNNINLDNIEIIGQERDSQHVRVSLFRTGSIRFSSFAMLQFSEGAELMPEITNEQTNKFVLTSVFKTYVKINNHLRKMLLQHQTACQMDWTREEVLVLKNWLKLRMEHCERERDERSEKFNPDAYIAMRYLMLELKELLMGDIVDYDRFEDTPRAGGKS